MHLDILRRNLSSFFSEEDFKALFDERQEETKKDFEKEENVPVTIQSQKVIRRQKPSWKLYLKFAGLFGIIFIIGFAAINYLALYDKFSYFWDTTITRQGYHKAATAPSPQSATAFTPTAEAKLIIPKIGVSAPIIWNVPEDQVQNKLLEGVVHYQNTALPGSPGNIFITGHSSYYAWINSPYKDIFALLEKLTVGDKIYIQYPETTLTYQIKDTKVVSPDELSVMDQGGENRLTLMSCVPVGTNLNRLIVTALPIPN